MPYSSISDLPETVRGSLPEHAQEIFKETFNNAWHEYHGQEERAFKVAWGAVKQSYTKEGNKWVRKAHRVSAS